MKSSKELKGKKVFVTGGAGFIGSHLVDRLIGMDCDVTVLDNLSAGKEKFLRKHMKRKTFHLIRGDMLRDDIAKMLKGHDIVFHLAANPDVRLGETDTYAHIAQNLLATHKLLEAMRMTGVGTILFTSTSTVCGEAPTPTPEDYGPCLPISLYGASKLASEAMISSYCHTFDMESVIFRFANIIGQRGTHGVIYDFINKLKRNPKELEILGDGKQSKSYCYISDCIDAMVFGYGHAEGRVEVFNVGTEQMTNVNKIADIVVSEMGLSSVKYRYVERADGGRGWKGDIKTMLLSIEKLKKLGWNPKQSSDDAVRLTAKALVEELR